MQHTHTQTNRSFWENLFLFIFLSNILQGSFGHLKPKQLRHRHRYKVKYADKISDSQYLRASKSSFFALGIGTECIFPRRKIYFRDVYLLWMGVQQFVMLAMVASVLSLPFKSVCVCVLYLPEPWALGQTRPICTFGYSSKVISKHTHGFACT